MATVTIQKRIRKKGTTYPVYYKDPLTGKKRYYKTFKRLKDAQQVANELRALLDNGKLSQINDSKIKLNLLTFKEVGDSLKIEWSERLKLSVLSEKTVEGYHYWLKYVGKTFDSRMLCEISQKEILDYRKALATNISNITSNRSLFIMKQVFKHGIQLNSVKENPVAHIKYLSEKDYERNEFLMPDGLRKLIMASLKLKTKHYLPAIIYLGAEHGASKQEILDLEWPDIDFEFGNIGLIRFFRTKTKKQRTEFLMPRTKQALLEWRKHQRWMRHRKKLEDNASRLVFCRLDGTPIKRFDKSWRKARELAGFGGLHFHDLRHTFCSNLLLSGSDLKDVKEMIGHRDLSMTDRYSHLTPFHKLSRQEKLARFYSSKNGLPESSGGHIGVT